MYTVLFPGWCRRQSTKQCDTDQFCHSFVSMVGYTLLYSTPRYATLRYATLLYSTLLYSFRLYSTLPYSTQLCTPNSTLRYTSYVVILLIRFIQVIEFIEYHIIYGPWGIMGPEGHRTEGPYGRDVNGRGRTGRTDGTWTDEDGRDERTGRGRDGRTTDGTSIYINVY